MNWAEDAEDYASAHHTYEHRSEHDNAFGNLMFALGAKWQRNQFDTHEAIERVARTMAGLEPDEEWPSNETLGGNLTGTRDDEYRDGMCEQAKEAINALLGEEP